MTDSSDRLRSEQQYIDGLYDRLDTLREHSRARLARVRMEGPSGSPQNRSERDAFAALHADRLAQLDAVEDRLCFGRLDMVDGSVRHVGRIGLTDEDHAPLLTDWRAPAATPFYRATPAHPEGAALRRHLLTSGRRLVDVEDEILDMGAVDVAERENLTGDGALMAALGARRTGRMADIVATIQAEQDRVIRSALPGVLVVQGGPGTGKTAVALHRAAYLMYTHAEALASSGVLLVGPSPVFLHYIDRVLPSLGETGVVSTTMADLLPGIRARGTEAETVAEIKGRSLWARVLRRAVRQRERVPSAPQDLAVGNHTVRLFPRDVEGAVARARRSGRPHNRARAAFVRELLGVLADRWAAELGATASEDRAELIEDLRTSHDVRVALNLAWLPITAQRLLADLYAKPHRLAAAAPELTDAERHALYRPHGIPWTPADVPLLDEAAELLGEDGSASRTKRAEQAAARERDLAYAREVLAHSGSGLVSAEQLAGRFAEAPRRRTAAEAAAEDRTWKYGHILVDEAQELSPMDWRALVRRCPRRSMTVVGDVGQRHAPGGTGSWARALDPLVGRSGWRRVELSVNYRTPAAIMSLAQGVARAAGLEVADIRSPRDVPEAVRLTIAGDLPGAVRKVTEAEAAELGAGRLAVIAPAAHREAVDRELRAGGLLRAGDTSTGRLLEDPVVLLDPVTAKGLEFDVVVLVEPGDFGDGPRGAGDLYVAMTRPTLRLHTVHSRPLPPGYEV